MNMPRKATIVAIKAAVLLAALAAHPALADPAPHGDEASQLAQVQGQGAGEATPIAPADQTPAMDRRRMGDGMMGGEHGMMGGGMGPMGLCPMMMTRTDKDFSAEQVRDILEGHIAWTGNERLKVRGVEKKDEESYVAEIVTVDDSLVQRVEVNRSTGAMRPID
jgi:hypothetical protein